MMGLPTLIQISAQQKSAPWHTRDLPPFLVDFPGIAKLTFFGWHVVVVYLMVAVILAQIVYHNNRNILYRYYQWYAILLLVFILTRNSYFVGYYERYGAPSLSSFGFLVQICYLCVYFRFGLLFLKLDKHTPRFKKGIFRYTLITSLAAIAFYGVILLDLLPDKYGEQVFYFLFLPVHLSLATAIIYKSFKSPEPHKRYFLWGSFFYIVFALISTFAYFYAIPFAWLGLQPIVYFFMAIIVECTLFAIGLGKQLRDHLQERYELQALLRETEREMQIKILRGQLNSHFIFNVLNSVKAFIIRKQVEEATDYLGKFSRFIRDVLEASGQETNSLRQELKTVLLYADIENIRLSNTLTIETKIDDRIDLDSIRLPAMILQPSVENAIWHGLSKSVNRDKKLLLYIVRRDDKVQIVVEDNGLGYSKTQKSESRTFGKAYGLRIVREQIQRFNTGYDHQLGFEIGDREGGGTRVVFTIAERPRG